MAHIKAVHAESFDLLRQKIGSMAPWYFLDKNNYCGIADTDLIDAAFEEDCWGDFPNKVFILGFTESVTFEEVIKGKSGMVAFRKYEDDMYFFLEGFEDLDLDEIKYSDAFWYFK